MRERLFIYRGTRSRAHTGEVETLFLSADRNSRFLTLEGGRNFRDLGGYEVADGRRIKSGVLFRSGSLGDLTQSDWESLRALGVRSLCDLRTPRERASEPFAWNDTAEISYYARDYPTSFGELREVLAGLLPTGESAREAMLSGYRELPFEQSAAYRQIFLHIAANEIPLVFNCSVGKDRAGTAAALILSALGVSRATIIEDYLLSNEAVQRSESQLGMTRASLLSHRSPEVVAAILNADPAYIESALDSVQERHGSVEQYLFDVLGIGEKDLLSIRHNLLES
jgi:protein-tyrosine phosphatase